VALDIDAFGRYYKSYWEKYQVIPEHQKGIYHVQGNDIFNLGLTGGE